MMGNTAPPATESDIRACEAAVGAVFPKWLRSRLAQENGWLFDDTRGPTGETWTFLPVVDRADRKRRKATAEDIAYHTRKLKETITAPEVCAVVAIYGTRRLVLLSDATTETFDPKLWRQSGHGGIDEDAPIDAETWLAGPHKPDGLRPQSELPHFNYHPDPVATGSIQENYESVCPCCNKRTGWRYCTRPYSRHDGLDDICPWCIADGSAAEKFAASFSYYDDPDVPAEVIDEVALRTPGFISWQQEMWLSHCSDAAMYLGTPTWEELKEKPSACDAIVDNGFDREYLQYIDPDGALVAYLFQCRHCGEYVAYVDYT
ncbi:MAG: CbrC family protein [Corynebacterium sp.]|uniref:CbrC family protein n=1 Tax=Corynebacterium sp. TaxID=1720 RepID=UPI0026DAD5DB|nr:CbrC family protein [Corynebacterium sp.]MDO5097196.1 CbrC family protein [Corynebacterium sp.]